MIKTSPRKRLAAIAITSVMVLSTCRSLFAVEPIGSPIQSWNWPQTNIGAAPVKNTSPATVVYMYDEERSGNTLSAAIVGYSTADGSVVSELELPPGYYYYRPFTTDAAGQIYVVSPLNEILIYPPAASGAATPVRTIQLPHVNSDNVAINLAVDPLGYIYVVMLSGVTPIYSISVYSPTADSFARPVRTLQLENIAVPLNDIAADAQGNIYLAACWSTKSTWGWVVAIYPPTSRGRSVPKRMIQFDHNTWANGVAVDEQGHLFVSVDRDVRYYPTLAIEEFDLNLRGPVRPINTINLPAVENVWGFGGPVRLDGSGNILTAAMRQVQLYSSKSLVVFGYSPTATGDTTPTFMLNGAWNLNEQIVFGMH